MTAREATARTSSPEEVIARPRLRSLPGGAPGRIANLPFGLLVVAILVVGTVGLMLLNTTIQNQSFQLRDAQREGTQLAFRASDLQAQVLTKSAPGELAAAAAALGMVPNPYPVFVDLRTAQVVGDPKAVTGNEIPALTVQPTAKASAPASITPVETQVQPWLELPPAPEQTAAGVPEAAAADTPELPASTDQPAEVG